MYMGYTVIKVREEMYIVYIPWKATVVTDGDIRTVSCKVTRSLAVVAEIRLAEQMFPKQSQSKSTTETQ